MGAMNRVASLVALIALTLAGCAYTHMNFVGTWHSEHNGSVTTWHFFNDGTVTTEVMRNGAYGSAKGEYSVSMGQLTMTNSTIKVQGASMAASDLKKRLGNRVTLNIKTATSESITFDASGEPLVLTRLSKDP